MQSTETWRVIPDYEGIYEVSDHGSVRRLRLGRGPRILSGWSVAPGYRYVELGRGARRQVHRLVLEAFVGPRPVDADGCHNDGDPTNNHLSNLRWDTRSANIRDAVAHGTHGSTRKETCPRGHSLEAPNLVRFHFERGRRSCKACHRAHGYVKYHGGDFAVIADTKYTQIMEEAKCRKT